MALEKADFSFRIPEQRYDTFAFTLFDAFCHSHGFLKNFKHTNFIVVSNNLLYIQGVPWNITVGEYVKMFSLIICQVVCCQRE